MIFKLFFVTALKVAMERSMTVRVLFYISTILIGLSSFLAGIALFSGGLGTFFTLIGLALVAVIALDIFLNVQRNRTRW